MALFLILAPISAKAQLVNIESRRMQSDSTRFTLEGNVSGTYTNVNGGTVFQARPSLATQVKSKNLENTFFFIGDYRLLRTQNNDIANAFFMHLRYNKTLSPNLKLEAFVQAQYDQVLAITSRRLLGLGIRVYLIENEHISLRVGNSYMYEREEANEVDEVAYYHRNSSYITLGASLPESPLSITNTLYYQPLYADFSDYRLLEQLRINVNLSEAISLFGLFNYYYDSVTLENTRQFSSTTSAGLGFSL